jgi:YD repeat-containing protein
VTRTQGAVPAGQTVGPIQTMQYDAAGRISRVDNLSKGAWKYWAYPDRQDAVQTLTAINSDTPSYYQITVVDGAGRLRAQGGDLPNVTGRYWGAFTYYDVMGRVSQTSNPAEISSIWTPTGEDAAGWVRTQQAYDWKGRPTVTTNPDGTTKEVTYGGCGCAGGEVVTLRDEVGREQRVTSDALGRTYKSEVLNWDQEHTLYSTTVNSYNARDQVTSTVEQGASGASQTTTLTYDGYGRLKEQQASSQTVTTKYAYNEDDTVKNMTDGRGIVATFSYNNRHQVTGISYSQQTGIAQTPSITFGYDAAGNRTGMTDGSGSVIYQYDQLSRLTLETKQFTDLPGKSYPLTYSYNLANQLTNVTDPTGASISYTYDQTGRMTDVTGTTFSGVTQYATNMQYRAWGAVKNMSSGDGKTTAVTYNSRLEPTDFSVSSLISKHYEYNADARLRYSQDNLDNRFDRAYSYDHLGRMVAASSGPLARGQADNDNRPYKLTYQYDAFDNLTQRVGRIWTMPHEADTGSGVYADGKNTGWQYDVDGRLLGTTFSQYTYDASGRAINIFSSEGNSEVNQTLRFDADGQRAKVVNQRVIYKANGTVTNENKTQYFVTSSVLNSVITELNESGQKTRTFVYQGTQVLAWQQLNGSTQTIAWEHRDVSNASVKIPGAPVGSSVAELEPMGSDAGTHAPLSSQSDEPTRELTYPGFGSATSSECRINGMDMPCGLQQRLMEAGALGIEYPGLPSVNTAAGREQPKRDIIPYGLGLFMVQMPYAYLDDKQVVWRAGIFYNPAQQNPERPLTKEEIEKIKGEVAAMLNKDKCKDFIKSLLAAAAKETGGTYSADVLANFDAVAKEGGFHARYERVGTMPNGAPIYAGGDQTGPSVGSGKARVDINPNAIAGMNQFNNIIYVALTALHEVLHASGERFDDSTFARAVAKMNGLDPPKPARNMKEVLERSGAWDKA